ncbi:hypothetical protein [Streptomyces bikiniensis]|uniref:hypothetical protein n=1 Tax=Streptomyces bikiniensis TaxID=1896 RepID=UPI0004BF2C67|nr:hypothetical protein [Streptomyces bikiniensis]
MRYREGDCVVDGTRALVGQVHAVDGALLTLTRPGGYEWTATARDCWTASPQERESLTPRGAARVISTVPVPSSPAPRPS